MLTYKGYIGHVRFDDETGLFYGEVLDIRDVVTFQSTSLEDLAKAFHDSIDDYLDYCKERGEQPDQPFSSRLMLRVSPRLSRRGLYAKALQEFLAWYDDDEITRRLNEVYAHESTAIDPVLSRIAARSLPKDLWE